MKIVLIALQLLCAAACLHYAITSRFAPVRAAYEHNRHMPWWIWIYFGFLVLGYGGMLYAAGRWLTRDLPDTVQQSVGVAAFFGALFTIDAFHELGRHTLRERTAKQSGSKP